MSCNEKIEGDESMKKLTKILFAALAIVTLGVSVATPASAASVNYVDYDKTTENIRKDIKQGKPTETDVQAGAQVTFVYKKNGTCGVSTPKHEKELPSTGTVENTITFVFSIILVAGGLYLVKSKTVLVLGGAGAFFATQVEVLAADSSILGQVVEQNDLMPEQVDCHDYVGYYITSSSTTQEETTTLVTTESTTETTTEEPTTTAEATTTTTTTTTTTEEPTTQTEATTSTESITVAPIDYL